MKVNKLLTAVLTFAALSFVACKSSNTPEKPGTGNNEDPGSGETPTVVTGDTMTVAEAIAYVQKLGADVESASEVYVKGVVSSITEISPSFGNGTFILSDAGASNQFTCYRVKYLENSKFTAEDQIQINDEVVIYGKIVNFKGNTPETVQGTAYVYSVNGVSELPPANYDDLPDVVASGDTISVSDAMALIESLGADVQSDWKYVIGVVNQITEAGSSQYGNATFTITDKQKELTCYRVKYLNNKAFKDGESVAKGDVVVVYAKLVNYKGNTPETVQNSGYIYRHNDVVSTGSTDPEVPAGDLVATFNNAIPEGWTYIPYAEGKSAEFYGDGGLKMNFEGIGVQSPVFDAVDAAEVVLNINKLNGNTKEASSENAFTITGYNAGGEAVATAYLQTVVADANTVQLSGAGITYVTVVMTAYPNDGEKRYNVNLGSIAINF